MSHEFLGVVIDTYPTLVVSGDPEKGVLTSHPLIPKPEYSSSSESRETLVTN